MAANDEQIMRIMHGALHYNTATADVVTRSVAPAARPVLGPPAEGLLGGQVSIELSATPNNLTGTIQVHHPNAAGTSVFHIHSTEFARVSENERSLQAQRNYLAFLHEFPIASSYFGGPIRDGSPYARTTTLADFDAQGHDYVVLCNLVCLFPEEIERQPDWVRRIHERLWSYLSVQHPDHFAAWRHYRMCGTVGFAGRWGEVLSGSGPSQRSPRRQIL